MSISQTPNTLVPDDEPDSEHTLQVIRDALRGLKYGSVVIIVQDGNVIQVDRTEKRRIRRSREKGASGEAS